MGARLVPVNYFDAEHVSDLAVSPAAVSTSYAITNLQSNDRELTWRSSSLNAQTITGSFGGNARQISHLSIWPSGAASSLIGAQIAVRMWSDVAKTTLVRNVAATDFFTFTGENYNSFLWGIQSWGVENDDRTARLAPFSTWFTPVAVSAFEIIITNAGAVDTSFFEARRIVLGDYVEAPYNSLLGLSLQWASQSQHRRRLAGALQRLKRVSALTLTGRHRELRGEIPLDSEAQRRAWHSLCYAADPGNEIVLSFFQSGDGERLARDYTVLGSLEVLNPMVWEDVDFHKLQLAIVES